MFAIDDDVEVYNGSEVIPGKVVAILNTYPDKTHGVVVRHRAFATREDLNMTITQRFNHDGNSPLCGRARIRHPKRFVYANIYSDETRTYGPAMPWCDSEASAKFTRGNTCVGYLKGEKHPVLGVINIEYVSLEKK